MVMTNVILILTLVLSVSCATGGGESSRDPQEEIETDREDTSDAENMRISKGLVTLTYSFNNASPSYRVNRKKASSMASGCRSWHAFT